MKSKLVAAILVEVVCLVILAHAQQPSPIADAEAERILDNAAKAEGGENVLGTLRTMRIRGSTFWGSSHLLGDIESLIKFPDKFCDFFTSSNGNELKYGFDGKEAWGRSTGGERSTGLPRIQILLPAAQWRLRYISARFMGEHKVEHREAYVIRALIHGQTSPADYYYDPVTYVLLRVDTAASEMPQLTYRVSNFQEIDGLKVPREWSFGENHSVIASIKVNIDIDNTQFAKPK